MKKISFYGRDGCPMCYDAKRWLEQENISYNFRDIFNHRFTKEELIQLGEKLPNGLFDLFAPKGARKAGLSENPRDFSSEQIVEFQENNPDMIRYPAFEVGNPLIFGFKEPTKLIILAAIKESGR